MCGRVCFKCVDECVCVANGSKVIFLNNMIGGVDTCNFLLVCRGCITV